MIEQDTIRLLRECDAGVKMGIESIEMTIGFVESEKMKKCLDKCKDDHNKLKSEIEEQLHKYHDDGKEPSMMAKAMSWMKGGTKLSSQKSDKIIADMMIDGCNMGVKSLSKYLNEYAAADEVSKDICKKLIKQEEELSVAMREFL